NNTFRNTTRFEDTYANDTIGRIAEAVIDEVRPDAAHIHHLTCLSTSIVGSLAARNIPAIVTLHDYWLLCHRGQLFDTEHRVCNGPEPAGCGSCLGAAAGASPVMYAGASVMRSIERALPQPIANGLRSTAREIATAATSRALGDDQARRRLDHMRGVC